MIQSRGVRGEKYMNSRKYFSIGKKIYLFVGVTVFASAFIVAIAAYFINVKRIDDYFKNLSLDTARNFSCFVDADYLQRLRKEVETQEYQDLRERAEEEDNEALIEEYLRDKGLWEGYVENREKLVKHLHNMDDVKYLYVVACGDENAKRDMYLLDDDTTELYEIGYYEIREAELVGTDFSKEVIPTISRGDWGWLCSAFVPVYNSEGVLVCQVGCDVGMNDIMRERRLYLIYSIIAALCITAVIVAASVILIRSNLIRPLRLITDEMKKFSPSKNHDYEDSGVMNLNIKRNDEIADIYNEIRSMQIRILDYLDDIMIMQREKERAELEVLQKEKALGQISREAYRDALTMVGSKAAYLKMTDEMNSQLGQEIDQFAIVMIDVNCLKEINDKYGHSRGDEYLKGCCRIVCQSFKRSPVFRIGGDEFTVIVTGDDYKERYQKLEEMKTFYRDSFNNENEKQWKRYSAAFGMSEYTNEDKDVEDVFMRADKAMYEDKEQFRKENKHGEKQDRINV